MQFKTLKFVCNPQSNKGFYVSVAVGFSIISAYLSDRDGVWYVQFEIDSHWGYRWEAGCMKLSAAYTMEEVQGFVQDAWEHYISTSCFIN